ncbi:Nuclear import receptor [Lithohypha guttulata]|uniref:Nuclear import receptor n=1 Tax=Lithohypha guttulata TaxID=1690604 RepID=A0AAN7SZP6_9EURO|nr:Nuclear import receptor [Lithohypha guttulata]
MASNTAHSGTLGPILSALATMQSNVASKDKAQAHEFLEKFQKSQEAWNTTGSILQDSSTSVEARLFAATTLKGKITYDLHQLPSTALEPLRDSLLSLLQIYVNGPRPIRTQLCICIASLAIQMPTWRNVLQMVGSAVSNSPQGLDSLLDFLRILPEEVTEGRKINLTEEQLINRTKELLEDNSKQVLSLLVSYAQASGTNAANPRLYECIASWLREIPAVDVVNSPLLDLMFGAISSDSSFDAAIDCLCTIFKDTRDVDENKTVIQELYPRLLRLRSKVAEASGIEDNDLLKGMTRLFAEAGEAWVVLIAREPNSFRSLVDVILECCAYDKDREAISITFIFWYDLKQYLTLEKYMPARAALADLYSRLVDIMINHLQFPSPEGGNEADLFDGDREQEDKFREFRHMMGDVLKDCCEVLSPTECLNKTYHKIRAWAQTYAGQAQANSVPHWQELEAPIFAVRAMGRMINPEETSVLGEVIPLLTQVPDHDKLKFQAIMALGRYTEWTAEHPETLEVQLNYVISGFQHPSPEVVQASALAFQYLGTDCRKLLGGQIPVMHQFYESIIDKLKPNSQEEVTEGVAAVVSVQPLDKLYDTMKMFCDPVMRRIVSLAEQAKDEKSENVVADYLGLIVTFIKNVQPYVSPNEENPAVKYCKEILPALSSISKHFTRSIPILERVCRCWRYMILSYRTATVPLIGELANSIAEGFQASRQGCFLWATDAVIREYSYGAEYVDQDTSDSVFQFFGQQATVFLRILNELNPNEAPDVIEDFFRLATDAVRFYPRKTITSPLAAPMVQASLTALTLPLVDPLLATLQFLRDYLDFGFEHPPISEFTSDGGPPPKTSIEVRSAVRQVLQQLGQQIVQQTMTGLMYTFPEDCYGDASAILLTIFSLAPEAAAQWVASTLQLLPPGSLKPEEANKLMTSINEKVRQDEVRKVRAILQDFTNSYRRRNVAPREGLGRLEATRFRFAG